MSVTDILNGGLSGALNLAASDGMAVGDAAEYMANALSMFHLKGSQASQVADTLAAGAGKAVGNVSDFGEALNNCGAQANSFGMNVQETTGVLALFAQNGTIGAEAGTQLNSMLMKLAAPSTEAANIIVDVCTPAFLIYAVVRTLRMRAKQQYHPISSTATSLTFVPVGPVIISPLVSFNAL